MIRIDGSNFHRFSEQHNFTKPNDECALRLANRAACAVMQSFADCIVAYGLGLTIFTTTLKISRISIEHVESKDSPNSKLQIDSIRPVGILDIFQASVQT